MLVATGKHFTAFLVLIGAAVLGPAHAQLHHQTVDVNGTLVMAVPFSDGLMIASDTRTTVGAQRLYCDGGAKLYELGYPPGSIISATGNATFFAQPEKSADDLCEYTKYARPFFDVARSIREASIATQPQELTPETIQSFIQVALQAVEELRKTHAASLRAFHGHDLFSVVIARYVSNARRSELRSFTIRLDADGQPTLAEKPEKTVHEMDLADFSLFGEADYVNNQVFRGVGQRFVAEELRAFARKGILTRDLTVSQAEHLITVVFQGAFRTALIAPPPTGGIGGDVDILVLTNDGPPQRLRWHH